MVVHVIQYLILLKYFHTINNTFRIILLDIKMIARVMRCLVRNFGNNSYLDICKIVHVILYLIYF